jgi:hypothetical protein
MSSLEEFLKLIEDCLSSIEDEELEEKETKQEEK